MTRTKMVLLAAALAMPLACTPTAEDWQPSTEIAAAWLADKGLALSGPMPAVAVMSPDELAANYDHGLFTESRDWVAGREIRAMTFTTLRVVQFSDRLDPERDRSTAVRELAGIVCYERGWCQGMTQDEREAWIAEIQDRFERDRPRG